MSAWADRGGRDVPHGFGARDVLEPRWDASVPLAMRITKRGRWEDVDPSEPGGRWSFGRWLGLAFYVGLVGGAFVRARARTDEPA